MALRSKGNLAKRTGVPERATRWAGVAAGWAEKKTGDLIAQIARLNRFQSGLQRLNVRGLQALGAADDFEFDRLAVVQRLVAIRLDRGKVYEYIFSGLALDETKAFAGVKPLHCSLFFAHFVILFSLKKLSGASCTEAIVPRLLMARNLAPAVSSCVFVTENRHKKRPRVFTRDRFTTTKAIQEQQTRNKCSTGWKEKQEDS